MNAPLKQPLTIETEDVVSAHAIDLEFNLPFPSQENLDELEKALREAGFFRASHKLSKYPERRFQAAYTKDNKAEVKPENILELAATLTIFRNFL